MGSRKRNHARPGGEFQPRILLCVLGLGFVVIAGVVIGKCVQGQQGQHARVKQAALALKKGRPDLALRLISPVLVAQPNDLQARTLVIRARVKMAQYRRALSHVNQLVMLYPDRIDVRNVRIEVLMSILYVQLSSADTESEVFALGGFETLFAMVAADVDRVSSAMDAFDLQMTHVRLESLQIRNLNFSLSSGEVDTDQQYEILERKLSASESTLESTLKQIIVERPRQFDAWQMYIDVLVGRGGVKTLREVANTLSGETQLPPAIAAELIRRLVLVENNFDKYKARLALGKKLQSAVHPRERADLLWIRTQATLGIFSGQAEDALLLLDQLSQPQRYEPAVLLIRAKALADVGRLPEVVNILQPLALKFPHVAAVQTPLGNTLAALGQLDDAARAYRASLIVIPEDVETLEGLANVLVRQGRVEEALDIVLQLEEKNPDRLSVISLQIQLAKAGHDEVGVRLFLERLATRQPQSEALLMVLIDGYDFLKAYVKVDSYAQTLLARHASSVVARLGLAKSCFSRGEHASAVKWLKPLHEAMPERAEITTLIGRIHLARGRYELATDLLASVVEFQPTNNEAAMLLAKSLAELPLIDEAKTVLVELLLRRPHLDRARFMLGQLEEKLMANAVAGLEPDVEKKMDLAAKVVQLEKKDLIEVLMTRFENSNEGEKMLALLEKWMGHNPQDLRLRRAKAEILSKMGRADDALATLEDALAVDREDLSTWRLKVNLLIQEAKFPAAERAIGRMSGLDEYAAIEAMLLSAALFEKAGLSQRTARIAARVAKLKMPRDSGRLFRMGQLLVRYDYYERARQCFERVAKGSPAYIAAEVEAIKLAFDFGDKDAARVRLDDLLATPKASTRVAMYLLQRRSPVSQQQSWLGECDQRIRIDWLPAAMRGRWILLRVQLAMSKQDWPSAVALLSSLRNNSLSSSKIDVTLAVLLVHLGQRQLATEILADTTLSSWLPIVSQDQRRGLDATLPEDASKQLDLQDLLALPSHASNFYTADIRDELLRDRAKGAAFADKYQRLGLARLALHVGLANLAENIATGLHVAYGDSILTQSLLADAQLLQGKSAKEEIDHLIEKFPMSSRATIELTQRHLARKNYVAANTSLGNFMKREHGNPMGQYLQAKLYFAQGNYDTGVAMMDSLNLVPHHEESNIATIDATQVEGTKSTRPDSLTAAMANDFAFALADNDAPRLDDALLLARLAVSLAPRSASTLDTLGWVSYLNGDKTGAGEYLYRAMSFAPSNITVHEHIAQWHKSQGQDQWAGYHREQASYVPEKIERPEISVSAENTEKSNPRTLVAARR